MLEQDQRPPPYHLLGTVSPAMTPPDQHCIYPTTYQHSTPVHLSPNAGLMVEGQPVCIFESPSPSRHSSDGSVTAPGDCCQVTAPGECCQVSPNVLYNNSTPYNMSINTTSYNTPSTSHSPTTDNLQYQLNRYWNEKVAANRLSIQQCVEEVAVITQNILRQVEIVEPRFSCTLNKTSTGRYDGFYVNSPTDYSVLQYLNHMAVFNFMDEGSVPGCAALKLCDGRKRSMSLWVEFITASGYLSARKIRSKFHSLVAAVMEKNKYSGVRLDANTNEVHIIIKEMFHVRISPAFAWKGTWPTSIGNWVIEQQLPWPTVQLAGDAMLEGITLVSKESVYMKDKQTSSEGDAWFIEYTEAEDRLIYGYDMDRKRILSILKCLRDRHLDLPGGTIVSNYHLKTLVLFEGEKHPCDSEWQETCYTERIRSILLQLIACLQSNQCLHYFQTSVDLFRGLNKRSMGVTARATWAITRRLVMDPHCWHHL